MQRFCSVEYFTFQISVPFRCIFAGAATILPPLYIYIPDIHISMKSSSCKAHTDATSVSICHARMHLNELCKLNSSCVVYLAQVCSVSRTHFLSVLFLQHSLCINHHMLQKSALYYIISEHTRFLGFSLISGMQQICEYSFQGSTHSPRQLTSE